MLYPNHREEIIGSAHLCFANAGDVRQLAFHGGAQVFNNEPVHCAIILMGGETGKQHPASTPRRLSQQLPYTGP